MIRKNGYWFSLATNAERGCAEIMLKSNALVSAPGIARQHRVARRAAVGDLQAEQAADQFDGNARRAAAFVEKRVELDDIDRAHQIRVVQQLHDEMRLAIGCAARHRGADAGRDGGIEKIDIETDMQHAIARPHTLDDLSYQYADTEFVDDAHVGDRNASLEHQLLLQRIDRADAEQVELVGADRGAGMVAEQPVEAAFAAQEGGRHAVHVAGLRRL